MIRSDVPSGEKLLFSAAFFFDAARINCRGILVFLSDLLKKVISLPPFLEIV